VKYPFNSLTILLLLSAITAFMNGWILQHMSILIILPVIELSSFALWKQYSVLL